MYFLVKGTPLLTQELGNKAKCIDETYTWMPFPRGGLRSSKAIVSGNSKVTHGLDIVAATEAELAAL